MDTRFCSVGIHLDTDKNFTFRALQFGVDIPIKKGFLSLESLHCRAARVIFCLPRDMPSIEVLEEVKCDSLTQIYKIRLAQLQSLPFYNGAIYADIYSLPPPVSMLRLCQKTSRLWYIIFLWQQHWTGGMGETEH
jgi:hypothetical protein